MDKDTRDVGLIIDIDHKHEEYHRAHPYRVTSLDNGYTAWLEKNYIEQGCEVISMGS
jgi:hypothetical protein